jgi:hypothetical protein
MIRISKSNYHVSDGWGIEANALGLGSTCGACGKQKG